MDSYGVRDVERLLGVSRATVRALVAAGFVTPERDPRNRWRFSFRDLIVLRTAKALADARVPPRRITRSLRALRRHLPESMPLSGLAIGAEADRVVVREGGARWQADSGQYLLEFGGDPATGSLTVVERTPGPHGASTSAQRPSSAPTPEAGEAEAAMRSLRETLVADPARLDARINLGLLLHEARRFEEAMRVYAEALRDCGPDPLLLFNLGVLLEDRGRAGEAAQAYRAAIASDPAMADAHYNLALLSRRLGRSRDAIRHMSQYRRLTRPRAG